MGKQEQIEKIAKWMGWHRAWVEWKEDEICLSDLRLRPAFEVWVPEDNDRYKVQAIGFDPFTNPSDCAKVMDEVVKRGMGYRVIYDPMAETSKWMAGLPRKSYGYSNNSESEAKMNALLEAIGKE